MNPFARTVCACADCVGCCRTQPGMLGPGDLPRILRFLGSRVASEYFRDSPGALVMSTRTGQTARIRTITPATVTPEGRCVFLDDQDRCRIHAVAPFGCAYVDTHMSGAEGQRRTRWVLHAIATDQEYQLTRARLPLATTYNPRSY